MSCAFCESDEIRQRIITENDLAFAFPTNIPITPGHTLVCPKRHVAHYEELTPPEKLAIDNQREQLSSVLKKVVGAEGFNFAWNDGEAGGQSISHFHLHIVPRKKGDAGVYQYDPRQFIYRPGPRAVSPSLELAEITSLIKNALAQSAHHTTQIDQL